MIPILSRAQMRAFDANAIEVGNVPSLVLMENAGRGAADVIVREALGGSADGKRVVVICGSGNNGGDGFVVARHMLVRRADVDVWLAGDKNKLSPDCRANHDAFVGIGGLVRSIDGDDLRHEVEAADVVVDAMFGTGLDRALDKRIAAVVAIVNEARCPKVALDVPSGMNADTGAAMGAVVLADMTVTFAFPKLGHVTGLGVRACGHVHLVDIGVPRPSGCDRSADLVESADVRANLVPRAVDAHKYRAGHVGVVAGSPGKIGASLLAARAALRGGAGAATIVTWPEAADRLETQVVEIMTSRLDEGREIEAIDDALLNKRAVVIGPGFGTDEKAREIVHHVLQTYAGPIVVDADALMVHAGALEGFRVAGGRAILTPHAGELARLLGTTSERIDVDRFDAARSAAAKSGAVVVLKGPHTIVASPDGRVVVNATGNPALATAGSGDVLGGLCAALACEMAPFEAAFSAAYIHGLAGDAWKEKNGDRGLLAGEIADAIPAAMAAIARG